MDALTQWLPKMSPEEFEQPVLNMTGLAGAWDFQLDFSPHVKVMYNGETVDPMARPSLRLCANWG